MNIGQVVPLYARSNSLNDAKDEHRQ